MAMEQGLRTIEMAERQHVQTMLSSRYDPAGESDPKFRRSYTLLLLHRNELWREAEAEDRRRAGLHQSEAEAIALSQAHGPGTSFRADAKKRHMSTPLTNVQMGRLAVSERESVVARIKNEIWLLEKEKMDRLAEEAAARFKNEMSREKENKDVDRDGGRVTRGGAEWIPEWDEWGKPGRGKVTRFKDGLTRKKEDEDKYSDSESSLREETTRILERKKRNKQTGEAAARFEDELRQEEGGEEGDEDRDSESGSREETKRILERKKKNKRAGGAAARFKKELKREEGGGDEDEGRDGGSCEWGGGERGEEEEEDEVVFKGRNTMAQKR